MRYTVLVVDDDPVDGIINKTLIEHICDDIDVEVLSLGRDALKRIQGKPGLFEVIFLDVQLPDMSGFELCKWIKERLPHIPVVGVTGQANESACIANGMSAYIRKPVTSKKIRRVIDMYLC